MAILGTAQPIPALRRALEAVPVKEKEEELFVLRDLEGLSAEEAAHVVGIKVGAFKSRLHRAREDLRKSLFDRIPADELDLPTGQLA